VRLVQFFEEPSLFSVPLPRHARGRRSLVILVVSALVIATGLLVSTQIRSAGAAESLLSQGMPATASSSENGAATQASLAFDGDAETRWSSAFEQPQWLQVDLGESSTIDKVVLNWEAAYASAFTIQTSTDGSTWTDITDTSSGAVGEQTLEVSGQGRYVRMNGTERATAYGFSLWEFEVYGTAGGTPEDPDATTTADPDPSDTATVEPTATTTATAGDSDADPLPTSDTPDFGSNVKIFDESMSADEIQAAFDEAFDDQLNNQSAQFGDQRYAFLFEPGSYGRVWANLGFYTSVAGLGINPDDVTIEGAVNVDSGWNYGDTSNATQNFWRSAENLAIDPEGGTDRWAVSQAAPMRRVHIKGDLTLSPSNADGGQGYASGGYLADSTVDGTVISGSQQQWYTRNSSIGSWDGGVWNMVFSGVDGAPAFDFEESSHTTIGSTPVTREKPYLYIDDAGDYHVFVPALQTDSSGTSWPDTEGSSIPMSEFYVVQPGDSAARINTALDQGLNLFFTPGTYDLDETIKVTRPDTVVTGIGFPTLVPSDGITALSVADVDGVNISGLTFDAGTTNSDTLMQVGTAGTHTDHADDPISIQDVFFRVGSSVQGKATTTLAVNSDDTIIDHIWAWRADHGGAATGWDVNTGDTGLLVNGDDVEATGLFVEHYQKNQVLWNGNGGRTIFFQNELPYDVPDQASWMDGSQNGYAAYKVADDVTDHLLWGGGSYAYFSANPDVVLDHSFEVPQTSGVKLHSLLTVSLGDVGTISNVVNDTGGAVPNSAGSTTPRKVVSYP